MANVPPPQPRTFVVDEVEVASYMNAIRDALIFLTNPPICNAVQVSAGTSVGNNAWTSLGMDTTAVDTYGGHSNVTNNSRYVSQAAGYYALFTASCWPSNSTGWRGARSAKNGGAIAGGAVEVGTNPTGVTAIGSPPVITFLNVGDYVESQGFQTSGGSLTTSTNSDADSSLTAIWIHA